MGKRRKYLVGCGYTGEPVTDFLIAANLKHGRELLVDYVQQMAVEAGKWPAMSGLVERARRDAQALGAEARPSVMWMLTQLARKPGRVPFVFARPLEKGEEEELLRLLSQPASNQ